MNKVFFMFFSRIIFSRLKLWRYLPDRLYLQVFYYNKMGTPLNLDNPITFNEKLQWLKLYDRRPEYSVMVDKYLAKEYVANIIGSQYIIPTLGVWDNVDDIDWNALPEKFVLKCTHDSGDLVICKDKSKLDIEKAKNKLRNGLKNNFWKVGSAWPYSNVKPRIIAEKFMISKAPDAPNDLPDYKFFCFNGEPKYCQVIRDRNLNETIDFYNMEWIHQDFVGLNPKCQNGLDPVPCPPHLDEMIKVCRKLAHNIPFVRVDLYVVDNKEYFGELTFYPASGIGHFTPDSWEQKLGALLTLPTEYGGGIDVS